tara:strand:+ start:1282 stop:1638 length:357 start_codon:yes stop_codon:yes gene_type:complete
VIQRFLAHKLLRIWAQAENHEINHIDFPNVSPMFRDYQSGYRASGMGDEGDLIPERVGAVLQEMHPALSRTIRQFYFEGRDLKKFRQAFNLAMSDFCKRYDSVPDNLSYGATLDRAIL